MSRLGVKANWVLDFYGEPLTSLRNVLLENLKRGL